ncbi:MAG: glycosyl transferase [Burkholderiales bacterium]|nr:glycosyl transferase [Burkholderiales bacterium]
MGIDTENLICGMLIAFLMSTAISVVLTKAVVFLPHAQTNARSLHDKPIPRVAALMLWVGWLAGASWIGASSAALEAVSAKDAVFSALLFCAWAAVAAISFWDDCRSVSARWRLLVQTAAAVAAAVSLWALTSENFFDFSTISLWGYGIVLVLSTVWMCNLFNFMDGSDGLAATMALVGLAAYAGAGYVFGLAWWWLPLLGVAALLPLLAVNLPPARMFIGDVGAVPLGFLAALFGWWGIADQAWGLWFPVLVFLPFVLDATVTLLRRLWRREKVWEGHKTHYYQRLLQMGAGHRGTLAVYAVLMAGCAGTAWACAVKAPGMGGMALLAWVLIQLGFFAVIDYHWNQRKVRD